MKIKTENFGEVTVNEEKVIEFKQGILGFEHLHRYILMEDEDENCPFVYLQSIEDLNICFILASPQSIMKEYTISISENYFQQLGGGPDEDFAVVLIVTIPEKIQEATVNLLAPLLIQKNTKKGVQIVLERTEYTVRHSLMELMVEKEAD